MGDSSPQGRRAELLVKSADLRGGLPDLQGELAELWDETAELTGRLPHLKGRSAYLQGGRVHLGGRVGSLSGPSLDIQESTIPFARSPCSPANSIFSHSHLDSDSIPEPLFPDIHIPAFKSPVTFRTFFFAQPHRHEVFFP